MMKKLSLIPSLSCSVILLFAGCGADSTMPVKVGDATVSFHVGGMTERLDLL